MNYSRTDDGTTSTLRVRGELDALSSPELRPLLDQLVADKPREVVVDLSELRLIDSSGVGALVSLYKRVRAQGGHVRFCEVTAQPLVIFKLLRLDMVFALAADAPAPAHEAVTVVARVPAIPIPTRS
jgi:anti-sigma B factor antagonist